MSWKNFGGIQQIKQANVFAKTITTDDIILRKAYANNFNINGSINVNENANINNNLTVNNTSTLNDVSMNTLIVNHNTIMNGDTIAENLTVGNILVDTIQTNGNAQVNSHFYLNDNHYLYGTSTGIGIDKEDPIATLDISSNQTAALNVSTSQYINKNILACNKFNNGIVLGAYTDDSFRNQSGIDFFNNRNLDVMQPGDSYIHSSDSGILTLKTQSDTQLLSKMVISGSKIVNTQHLSTETFAVYDDISLNPIYYFPDIYKSTNNVYLGKNTAFISSDESNSSTTMISLTDSDGVGAMIVGGHYPIDKRPMMSYGITDNCGNYMPTEIIVTGSPNNVKYLTTKGINTYTPRVNNYVLDINGPVNIDNGDIVVVKNTKFEILKMKTAVNKTYSNFVMAIGASTDVSGSFVDGSGKNRYRYSVLSSYDGGASWRTSTLNPSTLFNVTNTVLQNNIINDIDVYDCSYAFITGHDNTFIYTFDGGNTWQNIIIDSSNIDIYSGVNFNAIKLKEKNGGLSVYFSVDLSLNNNVTSYFTTFDVNFSDISGIRPSGETLSKKVILYNANMQINSIGLGATKMYLAGDRIIVYNLSDLSIDTSFNQIISGYEPTTANIYYYVWSKIYVYNDTYAVAIATGINNDFDGSFYFLSTTSIISVIKNNQIYNWYSKDSLTTQIDYGIESGNPHIYKYSMKCIIKDVYIYDLSNSVVVGYLYSYPLGEIQSTHIDGAFIFVSYNTYHPDTSGNTWNDISPHYLNASGKGNLLIGSSNIANNIVIPNPNTLLLSYSTNVSHFDLSAENCTDTGASTLYSCFTPNYLNAANNHVMDICGNVSIYGSLFANTITCTSLTQTSDYRIKKNIYSLHEDSTMSVDNLNPVHYINTINGKRELGFIAHELQQEFPSIVDGVKDGEKLQSVNYSGLVALLVKEIQVLKKEIGELKNTNR